MPRPYSNGLRARVIEAIEAGASRREVLLELIVEQSDLTLDEIVAAMRKKRISGSRSAVWRFFERRNISFKKSLYATEQKRAEIARARRRWMWQQGMFDPARLVFIDETWTSTSMVRLRGRCPRGERLIGYAPFVADLRQRGMVAPFVLEGAINGPIFLAYVKQCVLPILKRGNIIMIDNLPAHRVAGIREAIEAAGATLLYLPLYSPDFNPIEPAFSKFKAHLRKAAERTIPRLLHRIGRVVSSFSPQECRNFFQHAGYVRT
jgi:transposase